MFDKRQVCKSIIIGVGMFVPFIFSAQATKFTVYSNGSVFFELEIEKEHITYRERAFFTTIRRKKCNQESRLPHIQK